MTTKTCGKCHLELPLSEFSVKDKKTGRRQSKCKACVRAYGKQHYQANTEVYAKKAELRNAAVRATNNEYVRLSLVGKACSKCSGTEDLLYYQGKGATGQPVHMAANAALALDRVKEAIARSVVVCRPCLSKTVTEGAFTEYGAMSSPARAIHRATRTEPPAHVADPGRYKKYRALGSKPKEAPAP